MVKNVHSSMPATPTHLLLAYIADLELETDRLRKHGNFLHQQVREALTRIQTLCAAPRKPDGDEALTAIGQNVKQLASLLRDLRDPPGYHPAHDQVVAVAIRPMVDKIFRWQQRLENAPNVAFRIELESEHVDWFPARLRNILDNLISNALKYRDPQQDEEAWVRLRLRVAAESYEFTIADNGVGLSSREQSELFGLLHRVAPARAAGPGVGLAVVKLLVEESGGTLQAESVEGEGTTMVVVLPRYEIDDFLT